MAQPRWARPRLPFPAIADLRRRGSARGRGRRGRPWQERSWDRDAAQFAYSVSSVTSASHLRVQIAPGSCGFQDVRPRPSRWRSARRSLDRAPPSGLLARGRVAFRPEVARPRCGRSEWDRVSRGQPSRIRSCGDSGSRARTASLRTSASSSPSAGLHGGKRRRSEGIQEAGRERSHARWPAGRNR